MTSNKLTVIFLSLAFIFAQGKYSKSISIVLKLLSVFAPAGDSFFKEIVLENVEKLTQKMENGECGRLHCHSKKYFAIPWERVNFSTLVT